MHGEQREVKEANRGDQLGVAAEENGRAQDGEEAGQPNRQRLLHGRQSQPLRAERHGLKKAVSWALMVESGRILAACLPLRSTARPISRLFSSKTGVPGGRASCASAKTASPPLGRVTFPNTTDGRLPSG